MVQLALEVMVAFTMVPLSTLGITDMTALATTTAMASVMEVITAVVSIHTMAPATALAGVLVVSEATTVPRSVVTTGSQVAVHSVSSLASVPLDSPPSLVTWAMSVALPHPLEPPQHRVEVLPRAAPANNKMMSPFPAIL